MSDALKKTFVYNAVVRSVYDGDTMRVDVDLGFKVWMNNISLRLLGINTPEVRGPEREEGLKARSFVLDRVNEGTPVIIVTEKDKTGKYGRWLATVYYHNGEKNLNEELLQNGHAKEY